MWLGKRSSTTQLLDEHWQIYNAIAAQNEQLTSQHMLEHLSNIEAMLEGGIGIS